MQAPVLQGLSWIHTLSSKEGVGRSKSTSETGIVRKALGKLFEFGLSSFLGRKVEEGRSEQVRHTASICVQEMAQGLD